MKAHTIRTGILGDHICDNCGRTEEDIEDNGGACGMKAKFKIIPNGENYDMQFLPDDLNQVWLEQNIPESKLDEKLDLLKAKFNCAELTQIL